MAGLSLLDVDALPRASAVSVNDEVILRQGNQLVRVRASLLAAAIAGAAGFTGTFVEDGGDTVTVVNGVITGVAP